LLSGEYERVLNPYPMGENPIHMAASVIAII